MPEKIGAVVLPPSFCQHPLNINLQIGGLYHRFKTNDGGAVAGDKELAEIPLDGVALLKARTGLLVYCGELVGEGFRTVGIAFEGGLCLKERV